MHAILVHLIFPNLKLCLIIIKPLIFERSHFILKPHTTPLCGKLLWMVACYTVKSTYKLCFHLTIDDHNSQISDNWQQISTLKLPPKIKHFCWRLLWVCLQTCLNLRMCGVPCLPDYVLCSPATEDAWHLFLECPYAINC
jgi:hypothetical protein